MPSTEPSQLPPRVIELLRRFVQRRRWVAFVRAVGVAVTVNVLWLLAWGVVDRFLVTPTWLRLAVLLPALAAVTLAVVLPPLAALARREIDLRAAARQLERRDPARFGEMLVTVVSHRLAGPGAAQPGASAALIDRLTADVHARLGDQQSAEVSRLVPLRPAVGAWAAAFAAVFVFVDLCYWDWLGLPLLLMRQVAPLAQIEPVTSTQITVVTGSTDVVQGRPVTLAVRVQPAELTTATLRTSSTDGRSWSSIPMTLASDGWFFCTLPPLGRDLTYEVRAGDAVSGPHHIRLRRRPMLRELRIRLTYPPAVGREPLVLTSADGAIEAPVGTRASIGLVSSEPLKDAWLVGGEGVSRIGSRATADLHVREVDLTITSTARYQPELLSDRDVVVGGGGGGQQAVSIRAISDQPPLARLPLPEGVVLARPGEALSIPWQAADDYGLGAVELIARVNSSGTPTRIPLQLGTDARRGEGVFTLEMSRLSVAVGDAVSLELSATDRAGQPAAATPVRRVLVCSQSLTPEQYRAAAALREAARLADAVEANLSAAAATQPSDRASARISAAAESAGQLVRTLTRSQAGAGATDRALAVAALVDEAQVQASSLARLGGGTGELAGDELRGRIEAARVRCARLRQRVEVLWKGTTSALVIAQLAALDDFSADRRTELQAQVDTSLAALELDPRGDDVADQLRRKVESMRQLIAASREVDLLAAAREWASASASSSSSESATFPERLTAAGMVHAGLRPEFAADLQLAARAARAIEAPPAGARTSATRPAPADRGAYAAALAVLLRSDRPEAARSAMRAWAGDAQTPAEASAAAAQNRTGRIDPPDPASQPGSDPSREAALALVRRAQEVLAQMPQALGSAEQAASWSRQTQRRARQATANLAGAPAAQQPAERRSLAAAQAQVNEAAKALADIGKAIDPEAMWKLAWELSRCGPEAAAALRPIERELAPALESLHDAIEAGDPDATELASGNARQAIALVQAGLRDARQALLDRDPLVAARSFARRATTRPVSPQMGEAGPRTWGADKLVFPAARDPGPAGYQDALQVYFQVLNRHGQQVEESDFDVP